MAFRPCAQPRCLTKCRPFNTRDNLDRPPIGTRLLTEPKFQPGRTRLLFSLCSIKKMADLPASWRMHAETDGKAGRGSGTKSSDARSGSRCGAPRQILGISAQGPSRRNGWSSTIPATSLGDSAPRSARLLPPMRAYRGDPDRRCGSPLWL